MDPPTLSTFVVGSANDLICMCNHSGETYIWNPSLGSQTNHINPLRVLLSIPNMVLDTTTHMTIIKLYLSIIVVILTMTMNPT
uniref:F-box domain-containing protein n=1 Tax=Solanum tuberosum TaxID=4113 RepID=M1D3C5_SOLTU